ncbi:MAG: CBS domain-containing protein [Pseudomonadota bacterium]
MTCKSIVAPVTATLAKGDSVAEAVKALAAHGFATLPVVDAKGHFLGVFGVRQLLALLLPRAARLGEDDMPDLSFVSDTSEDIKARLKSFAKESVGKAMAPHRTVRAETALVEAMLLLERGDGFLPVVDEAGKLAGILTAEAVVARLAEGL